MKQFKIVTAEKIAKSYNKHKENLIALETSCGCNDRKHWTVANEMVVLRRLLQDLGFNNLQIDKYLHKY